jgi:hypothetical protein
LPGFVLGYGDGVGVLAVPAGLLVGVALGEVVGARRGSRLGEGVVVPAVATATVSGIGAGDQAGDGVEAGLAGCLGGFSAGGPAAAGPARPSRTARLPATTSTARHGRGCRTVPIPSGDRLLRPPIRGSARND